MANEIKMSCALSLAKGPLTAARTYSGTANLSGEGYVSFVLGVEGAASLDSGTPLTLPNTLDDCQFLWLRNLNNLSADSLVATQAILVGVLAYSEIDSAVRFRPILRIPAGGAVVVQPAPGLFAPSACSLVAKSETLSAGSTLEILAVEY